jgi:hypothetical protein
MLTGVVCLSVIVNSRLWSLPNRGIAPLKNPDNKGIIYINITDGYIATIACENVSYTQLA